MILKRRVSLDGVQLDEVDSRILIQGIEPGSGKDTLTTAALGSGDGGRVTVERRDSLDIAVKFTINEKSYNPDARAEVFEKVMAWAGTGGWLRCSYKPQRKIRVVPAQLPAEGDILNRGNAYSITFRAIGVPWWQAEAPESTTLAGTELQTLLVRNSGTRVSPLEGTVRNSGSGTVNTVAMSCGSRRWDFSDLGLAVGETLVIDHDDNGRRCLQRIRILASDGVTYRSALAARSGHDEILLEPGDNAVRLRCSGSWTASLVCPGRFW